MEYIKKALEKVMEVKENEPYKIKLRPDWMAFRRLHNATISCVYREFTFENTKIMLITVVDRKVNPPGDFHIKGAGMLVGNFELSP